VTSVIVAGAGLAGLTAAYRLTQAGHSVTVLEARDRVGGRVRSVTLENGAVGELGGEWIERDQCFVSALTLELGLSMSPVGVDFARRDLAGFPPIPTSEHRRVAETVLRAAESVTASERLEMTSADLLAEADDGSPAFAVLRQRLEGSAGVPLRRVAADEIVGDFGIGESTYLRIDQGNEALAKAAAGVLPDVRTGQPVLSIEATDRWVEVHTIDQRLIADAAVVAVPLPAVSRIRFTPPLPSDVVHALAALTMGTAAKFVAGTESTPPLLARQSGEATWWCWTGAGKGGTVRSVVSAFAGTSEAIESVSSNWPERLATTVPEVTVGPGEFVDWGQEEWFEGCYSAVGPGDRALLGAFAQEGRIVFAGEHTLGAGSIDGAIESGELAAARVTGFLSHFPHG
jgi:monoamine oxidase